jgi:hypothetical protein
MATADNGLAAVIYSPSTVSAILEESARVLIAETTDYPFDGHVNLTLSLDRPSEFPLYLRIPGWTESARIWINGAELRGPFPGGKFALIRKSWRHGDQVKLEFPMEVRLKTWDMAEKPVSVRRGPLWYSLRIGEEWRRNGGTEVWPAFEVAPTTPWNYGLVLKSRTPDESVRSSCRNPVGYQPFEAESAPLVLSARGKRLGGWKAEGRMVGKIPRSPVTARGKVEKIELIPMGCARLRISSFPTVKTGPAGRRPAKKKPVKRSTGSRK